MSVPYIRKLFTTLKGRSASEEQIIANRTTTQTLLRASFNNGEHDAFKEHMENNPVRQDFKGALKQGINLVRCKTRTMSEVAPTLKVLLQNGAKWSPKVRLMPTRMTPYHVICSSTGDHHDLLELMIKELGRELVNTKVEQDCTALNCAVQNANIKCVECLIANGADVNFVNDNVHDIYNYAMDNTKTCSVSPLIDSIRLLHPDSSHSSNIMMDIFDLLLDSGADVNKPCIYHKRTPVMYAADIGNAKCVQKLIQKGALLNPVDNWLWAARSGSVDLLKHLVEDNGIDKDSTDVQGYSVLYWAVTSGKIEAIRYLLNLGVTTSTCIPRKFWAPCGVCGTKLWCNSIDCALKYDICMRCIDHDTPELVMLMEEHGFELCKHICALIYAIRNVKVKVVDYLLSNYNYPLNYEYIDTHEAKLEHHTLLTDACQTNSVDMVKLLLENGADPNIKSCAEKHPSVFNVAISNKHVEIIGRFIRGGLNVNTKSYYQDIGDLLPFEAAVSKDNIYAAEMLLVTGCSCGVHSLDNTEELKDKIKPKLQKLLKKWNVYKNNVIPLQRRCRMVILNHLSPQADKKIVELPLPTDLVKYLSIPELDDIIDASKKR